MQTFNSSGKYDQKSHDHRAANFDPILIVIKSKPVILLALPGIMRKLQIICGHCLAEIGGNRLSLLQ